MKSIKIYFWAFQTIFIIFMMTNCTRDIMHVEIAKWRGNAKAAYTIIHDDLCSIDCSGIYEYADTIAYNRGLKIAAGAIVESCVDGGTEMWANVQRMADHGHEILSHSWDHGAAIDLGWTPQSWSNDTDVVMSKEILETNVKGIEVTYFIFPYDAYNQKRKDELKKAAYLGCRAGKKQYEDRGVNIILENFDPFSNCYFDSYMSKEEQDKINLQPYPYDVSIYNNKKDDVEIQHLNSAIAAGGWSIQEMHSVDDEEPWGWGRIGVDKYRALLDYAKEKADKNEIWMDTPTAVIKYIMTKNIAKKVKYRGNKIIFPKIPESFNKRYLTKISIIFSHNQGINLTAKQGENTLEIHKLPNGNFLINVNPAKGSITIL